MFFNKWFWQKNVVLVHVDGLHVNLFMFKPGLTFGATELLYTPWFNLDLNLIPTLAVTLLSPSSAELLSLT